RAAARRLVPQLCAHAVGQEDPRVVAIAARRARHDDRDHEPLVARRPRSEFVRRLLLDARALRPSMAGAAYLWIRTVHELGTDRAEGALANCEKVVKVRRARNFAPPAVVSIDSRAFDATTSAGLGGARPLRGSRAAFDSRRANGTAAAGV